MDNFRQLEIQTYKWILQDVYGVEIVLVDMYKYI